jgi:hypothetical protein
MAYGHHDILLGACERQEGIRREDLSMAMLYFCLENNDLKWLKEWSMQRPRPSVPNHEAEVNSNNR